MALVKSGHLDPGAGQDIWEMSEFVAAPSAAAVLAKEEGGQAGATTAVPAS